MTKIRHEWKGMSNLSSIWKVNDEYYPVFRHE